MERRNTQEHFAGQPSRTDEYKQSGQYRSMQVPVVTQNMPDDTFDEGGPMVATHGDKPPTRRELEQDVTMTNPSVESMEGRG